MRTCLINFVGWFGHGEKFMEIAKLEVMAGVSL